MLLDPDEVIPSFHKKMTRERVQDKKQDNGEVVTRTFPPRLTVKVKALHREQWGALTLAELRTLRGLLVKALWGDASLRDRHPLEVRPPVGS